jgi:hypothetical protein
MVMILAMTGYRGLLREEYREPKLEPGSERL